MPRPTETALKSRARALLEAMSEALRFIYAVPRDDGPAAVRAVTEAEGMRATAEEEAVTRYASERGKVTLITRDLPDLDVLVVEAAGEDAPPLLAKLLDQAGFYAQSTLLGSALDLDDEEAPEALATLAHMVVAWDKPWRELFALHLGAADATVRRHAIASVVTAARASNAGGPARELLADAASREKDAAVLEAIRAAEAQS